MKTSDRTEMISFSVKGQVVIPRGIRNAFEIGEGTRAVVYPEGDHIVIKPITARHYKRIRGSLKGTKAMDVFLAERRRERDI